MTEYRLLLFGLVLLCPPLSSDAKAGPIPLPPPQLWSLSGSAMQPTSGSCSKAELSAGEAPVDAAEQPQCGCSNAAAPAGRDARNGERMLASPPTVSVPKNVTRLQSSIATFMILMMMLCLTALFCAGLCSRSKNMRKTMRPALGIAKQWVGDLSDVFVVFPIQGLRFALRCLIFVPLRALHGLGCAVHCARKLRLQQQLLEEADATSKSKVAGAVGGGPGRPSRGERAGSGVVQSPAKGSAGGGAAVGKRRVAVAATGSLLSSTAAPPSLFSPPQPVASSPVAAATSSLAVAPPSMVGSSVSTSAATPSSSSTSSPAVASAQPAELSFASTPAREKRREPAGPAPAAVSGATAAEPEGSGGGGASGGDPGTQSHAPATPPAPAVASAGPGAGTAAESEHEDWQPARKAKVKERIPEQDHVDLVVPVEPVLLCKGKTLPSTAALLMCGAAAPTAAAASPAPEKEKVVKARGGRGSATAGSVGAAAEGTLPKPAGAKPTTGPSGVPSVTAAAPATAVAPKASPMASEKAPPAKAIPLARWTGAQPASGAADGGEAPPIAAPTGGPAPPNERAPSAKPPPVLSAVSAVAAKSHQRPAEKSQVEDMSRSTAPTSPPQTKPPSPPQPVAAAA
eukprot:CAMPEP_0203914470 /NCGR_PEP_ID=MMETSP0359-20131031/55354_1 /ASSEMBLY_ACC=CAM_ASM_000338 /TAXON_ID=268821 /ORGANISM="Scrippsiella Hangoei, Strain SHTV-5" /LENGTH=627 /DNA_ID=CAMNT_0050840793 /DNA_START=26 /DNA_END=1906 /DNA_ORIENTATION=+